MRSRRRGATARTTLAAARPHPRVLAPLPPRSPVTADDPKCEAKEEVITASASKPAATALATLLVAATCWAAH